MRTVAGHCQGKCSGTERSALDSPAMYVRVPGEKRKIPMCKCCLSVLRRATPPEDELAVAQGRLDPSVKAQGAILFRDDECGYDVVDILKLAPR